MCELYHIHVLYVVVVLLLESIEVYIIVANTICSEHILTTNSETKCTMSVPELCII